MTFKIAEARLLLLAGLLAGGVVQTLWAAARGVTTSRLAVAIRPEHAITMTDTRILLKIRLAAGTTASVWSDRDCSKPSGELFIVQQSGSYEIPIAAVMNKGAQLVCLESSDKLLRSAVPVPDASR